MSYEFLLYEVQDGVATLTLNRPDQLNALIAPLNAEIRDAMAAAAEDSAVKVIVLTGAGRGFCAGADMKSLDAVAKGEPYPYGEPMTPRKLKQNRLASQFNGDFSYFPSVPKPIIAAVNGPAAGVGFVMMLYCDLRFASDKAVIASAFSRRGLVAEYGSSWILPRLVGVASASDILFSGRKVSAEEALQMGLVSRIIPHEQMMQQTLAYAKEMAAMASPRSMRVMKEQIYGDLARDAAQGLDLALDEMRQSLKSEDFKEGIAHFLEQRAPKFSGK